MAQTTGSVILVGSMVAALGATAIVAGPRLVRGSGDAAPPAVELDPARRGVLDGLAEMIGRSREVLAVHEPGAAPHAQVVLWLADRENPGTIDPEEVGVITHSRVLQTVSFSAYEAPPADGDPRLDRPPPPAPEVTREAVRDPSFGRRWRACEGVRSRLVARGVSELRVTPAPGRGESSPRLRISLTWAAETSDGPDKASTVVDARGLGAELRSER